MTAAGWVLLLVTVHEAGHAVCAQLLGYRPSLGGRWHPVPLVCVRIQVPLEGLRRRDDVLIALAGPTASLLLGLGLIHVGFGFVGGLSILLGLVSLIPVGPQDGTRILHALR